MFVGSACGEETTQLYNIQILCVHMMDGHVPYKCIHVNEKLSRERIGVGFEHKILTWIWPNILSTMCAYYGWACSIEMHASNWEVFKLVREILSLNFETPIKGNVVYAMHYLLHYGLL